jgi:hypothetical protein
LANLKLISICAYLTDTDVKWRKEDFRAQKMVKAVKGDTVKGYFSSQVGGVWRKYDQNNVKQFTDRVPRALAIDILRHCGGPATIVPIPNSHVVVTRTPGFETLELANEIAKHSGGQLKVSPALVFNEVQKKSREGGPRDAAHFEKAYVVTVEVEGTIVLLDDVCTGGGHLIGAYRRLHSDESPVALACTFGRSTKEQIANPVGLRLEQLEV